MRRAFLVNLAALTMTWLVLGALIRVGAAMHIEWLVLNGAEVLAAILGLVLARRFRAQFATYVLAAFGAYALVMFAIHHGIDARAAQGGAVHMAVLGAAAIGVIAGALLMRRPRAIA